MKTTRPGACCAAQAANLWAKVPSRVGTTQVARGGGAGRRSPAPSSRIVARVRPRTDRISAVTVASFAVPVACGKGSRVTAVHSCISGAQGARARATARRVSSSRGGGGRALGTGSSLVVAHVVSTAAVHSAR